MEKHVTVSSWTNKRSTFIFQTFKKLQSFELYQHHSSCDTGSKGEPSHTL